MKAIHNDIIPESEPSPSPDIDRLITRIETISPKPGDFLIAHLAKDVPLHKTADIVKTIQTNLGAWFQARGLTLLVLHGGITDNLESIDKTKALSWVNKLRKAIKNGKSK